MCFPHAMLDEVSTRTLHHRTHVVWGPELIRRELRIVPVGKAPIISRRSSTASYLSWG